jgi:hypothetical protein
MNHKQQQEFETWLVEQKTLKENELTAASPNGQEAIRQVLYWLEEAHRKFLELTQEHPPAAESAPKHAHMSHSTPKAKSSH